MTEAENTDLTPLYSNAIEIVVDNWTKNSTALPLARLGQILGSRGHNLRLELAGRKMAEVIREDLADSIRLISHPNNDLLLGAIPESVKIEGDISVYFKKPQPIAEASSDAKLPRFHREIWMAFTKNIAAGNVRTLSLEPKPQFQDVSKEAAEASGKYRIQAGDIIITNTIPISKEEKNKVAQAIVTWAQRNDISIENLYHRSYANSVDSSSYGKLKGSLLDQVLSILSEDELKMVQLPLSVIKKLVSH